MELISRINVLRNQTENTLLHSIGSFLSGQMSDYLPPLFVEDIHHCYLDSILFSASTLETESDQVYLCCISGQTIHSVREKLMKSS